MGRLPTRFVTGVAALVFTTALLGPLRSSEAQYFGGYGYPGSGYGGMGYGGMGYGGGGFAGMGGLGYGGYAGMGGFGYGGFGGMGYGGMGYVGYGGMGYGGAGYGGYGGMGYGGAGYGNYGSGGYGYGYPYYPPGFAGYQALSTGLTPLAVQSAVSENILLNGGGLPYGYSRRRPVVQRPDYGTYPASYLQIPRSSTPPSAVPSPR